MSFTEGMLSPELFRKWAGIAAVAGALERRVWVKMGRFITFPNLYTMLVAPPGVGKYVIEEVRALWTLTVETGTKTPAFKVAPDSVTKASLMDELVKSKSTRLTPEGPPLTYHSLLLSAEEFGVLLPAYDQEFIVTLNSIYNNKPLHRETRRTGSVREVTIELPQLNILAGVQPGWLASTFPEVAWSTGLTSRMIMVYASETPLQDLFADPGDQGEQRSTLLRRMSHFASLQGLMRWTPEAAAKVAEWHLAGGPPVPSHSKLEHYRRRRTSLHVPKLAMVSAASRTGRLVIDLVDVERAIAWLLEAEVLMPDIFRAMIGKSDKEILEELHFFATAEWNRTGRKPLHDRAIIGFLSHRVPSDKIEKILAIADRANILVRVAGSDQYLPKPRHEHGIE